MGRKPTISEAVRAQFIALHKHTSQSHREIATNIDVSHSSVTKIIYLYLSKRSTSPKKATRAPKKVTTRMLHAIREVTRNPFVSSAQIKSNLAPLTDSVSARTIRHDLNKKKAGQKSNADKSNA